MTYARVHVEIAAILTPLFHPNRACHPPPAEFSTGRLRETHEPAVSANRKSLFDTLPVGVVENVIRCLGEYPSLKQWRLRFSPGVLSELTVLNGAFSYALQHSAGNTLAIEIATTKPFFDVLIHT